MKSRTNSMRKYGGRIQCHDETHTHTHTRHGLRRLRIETKESIFRHVGFEMRMRCHILKIFTRNTILLLYPSHETTDNFADTQSSSYSSVPPSFRLSLISSFFRSCVRVTFFFFSIYWHVGALKTQRQAQKWTTFTEINDSQSTFIGKSFRD